MTDHTPDVSALLLCPKGHAPKLHSDTTRRPEYAYYCPCDTTVGLYPTKEDARQAWNASVATFGVSTTRATPTPADQGDLVERLTTILREQIMSTDHPVSDWERETIEKIVAAMPAPDLVAEVARLRGSLAAIKALISYAGQDVVSEAQRQCNTNEAFHIARAALEPKP